MQSINIAFAEAEIKPEREKARGIAYTRAMIQSAVSGVETALETFSVCAGVSVV